jgi:putative DNA-invertase from lambdoid prophage Rac
MSSLAEFERDLLRERVKSGLAAARARGRVLGRQKGFRPKADKLAPKVLKLARAGHSYGEISRQLRIDKNTVFGIVQRARDASRDCHRVPSRWIVPPYPVKEPPRTQIFNPH